MHSIAKVTQIDAYVKTGVEAFSLLKNILIFSVEEHSHFLR